MTFRNSVNGNLKNPLKSFGSGRNFSSSFQLWVGGKTEIGKGGKNGTLRFLKPSASVLPSLTGLPVAKKGLTLTNQIC